MMRTLFKAIVYFSLFLFVFMSISSCVVLATQWSNPSVIIMPIVTLFLYIMHFKIKKYAKEKGYLQKKQKPNKDSLTTIKTTPKHDESLQKFIIYKIENDNRIVHETLDLINNSKNIETVLSRIQFGYNKGFIKSKDELQIDSIKRCYQILLSQPTPKNKTKSIEKYKAQVNGHKNEFSSQVINFVETFVQSPKELVNVEIKHDFPFDDEYLNTVLEDGKTVKEHMQKDYEESIKRYHGLDKQEDIELNELEEQFINEFKKSIKPFCLDTEIRYNRMSSKCLNFSFRDMQIGRIQLNGRKMWIQVLFDDTKNWDVKYYDIYTLKDATIHIDEWIKYLNYLIKD